MTTRETIKASMLGAALASAYALMFVIEAHRGL